MNKLMAKIRDVLAGPDSRWKLLLVGLAGILIGILLHWGLSPTEPVHTEHAEMATQQGPSEPATVWTCSMHPQIRMPEPGLCPICNMELIPLMEEESEAQMTDMRRFTTSEAAKALMNIETAMAERRFVTAEIRMVGKIEYDETRVEYITAWVPGRLDRLYVDYTGVPVKKGDHMVYLYSPELLSAQEELIQAAKAVENIKRSESDVMRQVTTATLEAAREKLRLWGLTPEQIERIEKHGTASDHITIYSPASGIVVHKNAQEGMYVDTGTRIYTVADLSHVWVKLDAYESDLSWLRYGQEVEFTTISFPGETFKGIISFIDPVLNPVTRTVKIRVDVPNQDGKLKPQMFVKAVVKASVAAGGKVMDPRLAGKWICPMHPSVIKKQSGECDICEMPLVRTESLGYVSVDPDKSKKPLVIPASAALVTGTRAVVYVEVPDTEKPTYEGREIVLGPRAGDYYIVRSGLSQGQRVVTKGNFKIDSALQIQAKPSMMTPEGTAGIGEVDLIELPVISRKQFNDIIESAQLVFKAVENLDRQQIKLSFAELQETIEELDPELLAGELAVIWDEISMRLKNDAIEGRQAQSLEDAQRVVQSLKSNIASLKKRFSLVQNQQDTNVEHTVNVEFRKQLKKVYESYFQIHTALADDQFKQARSAVEKMKDAVNVPDMKLLSHGNHTLWMQNADELKKILSDAAKSDDIEKLRQKFALLSEQIYILATELGIPPESTYYQLKCPMAFNNRGATWIQEHKETQNPYFGSAMLKCGSVIEIIEEPESGSNTETGGGQYD